MEQTIAADLLKTAEYPWELLPKISAFIKELGATLPKEKFEEVEENVWIAKTAKVAKTAFIAGPCIIDVEAEIRHCAFIRGNAIVGKGAVVGNSHRIEKCYLV